ncbi:unnamed protein product [Rotaria sp. Silwood2]|nr:unnamed protein product [Rotaria sp. Silwood2]
MSGKVHWCSSPTAHRYATKTARNPTYIRGNREIVSSLAAFITRQYLRETGDDKLMMIEGDVLCRTCYETARKQFFSQLGAVHEEETELWDNNAMEVDYNGSLCKSLTLSEIEASSDDTSSDELSSSSLSSNEETTEEDRKYHQSRPMSMLNEIFKIVDVSPIVDMYDILFI